MRTALLVALVSFTTAAAAAPPPDEAQLRKMAAEFAPVELRVELAGLGKPERQIVANLVEVGKIMDALFLRQVWAGNEPLLMQLAADGSPLGRARLALFLLEKGPWDRLRKNVPFLPGVGEKPAPANFYPEGATKPEIEAWMKSLPEAQRRAAAGFYTVIRRAPDGKFNIVPYSMEYQNELSRAAALLRQSAALAVEPSLKKFLETRADAFLKNDYYASDVAWMQLDSRIEPTIGPYEVYEDDWFNAKAAFESFINLRDDAETQKLAKFSSELQGIEDHLPIDPKLRNPKLGALAPIRVVNELYCSGDASHGVQTAAYNLPNDERIEKEMGTKRVMLKNVQQAKFDKILIPIARIALSAADQKNVAFDSFFTHILMHELMHGLGPHVITVDGKQTTVRESLQSEYSAMEEAKADVSGLWAMQYLVDKGVLPKAMEKTMYTTYLASSLRSIRFGVTEAHGKGQAMQLNYFLDAGAVKISPSGSFTIDASGYKQAVRSLTTELMTLQAHGDRAGAHALLERLGVVRPPVQAVLDKLRRVPVDIAPRFITADQLP